MENMGSLRRTFKKFVLDGIFPHQKADYLLKRDAQSTQDWDETFGCV